MKQPSDQNQSILVVGPAWVGDMVMAQSLFKIIKQTNPLTNIDVIAPEWTFSVLHCMPEVRQAIALPLQHGEFNFRKRLSIAKQLRNKYSQAIVLPNSWKSALIPWLAKIPQRSGWLGELRFGLLNDWRILDKKRYKLMIEQFMALGLPANHPLPTPYPYPQLAVTTDNQLRAAQKLNISVKPAQPILALGAGAAFGSSKRWPATYFAQLAHHYLELDWQVWLFGSPQDQPITAEIMQLTSNRCINIAGKTELAETIALLSLATGVVSNDSGLMHLAAAVDKPVIAIYGSTSPNFTPPLTNKAQILQLALSCQPCFARECPLQHHNCMKNIYPQQVIAAVEKWLRPCES